MLLLITLLCPLAAGIAVRFVEKKETLVKAALALQGVLAALVAVVGGEITLLRIGEDLSFGLKADGIARFFLLLMTVMPAVVGYYSFGYMAHEGGQERFYSFYLLTVFAMTGVALSDGLVSFYAFYEFMTLLSMPLVMHSRSRESVAAAMKYLIYSVAGAMLGLFGIFMLYANGAPSRFVQDAPAMAEAAKVLPAVFALILGFGTKGGMFPMHGWLPTAHPVAPSPASAVLSGVITKAGVLGVLRTVYYVVGADAIRGTWVQTAWMVLALITVFMGSMLAYREKLLKKRLAYSTVSQVSYVLFGLSLLNATAFQGAMMHVLFHSLMKCLLFMGAGAIIMKTEKTMVADLQGIGKRMPVTMVCFAVASLGLVGIPPMCGFVSKWYLATGAMSAGVGAFGWIGPMVLILSAILTAGYLLPIVIHGFFPGSAETYEKCEVPVSMRWPMVLLAALIVFFGVFPNV